MGEFINCSFCLKSIELDNDEEFHKIINCSNDVCNNILCGDCHELELTYCKTCVVEDCVLELELLRLTNQIDSLKEVIDNHQIYFDTDSESESDLESEIELDSDSDTDSDDDFIFNRKTNKCE
jgi:hypothetical protein